MLDPKYRAFHDSVAAFVPIARIITDPLRLLAYGTDASFYRLVPKIVINVETEAEVARILRLAHKSRIPVTFRAAGTSLSGQAVTDSVLIRLGEGWTGCRVYDQARRIDLEPGIIGAHANRTLAPFGKKIGPDPASIDSCKIGGILANNASGMCCGVAENSYQTLEELRLVLVDGTILDTGDDESKRRFREKHPEIVEGLVDLRRQVISAPELEARIRHKFKIKNTTGYSLNALVDFEDPFDILKHLLVGSEGTLAFISKVTYRTVTEHAHKASALMLFPDIRTACEATIILKKQPVAAVELMDRPALRSVQDKDGMPPYLRELSDTAAALLVETRAEDKAGLNAQIETIKAALAGVNMVREIEFTPVPQEFAKLWNIRKGLFPAVGSVRATGTTVIIEDVAFPIERLADATLELQELLEKYGYSEAIIFGHALEGNLHFVFTQDFGDPKEVERYSKLMDDVTVMVVEKYDGSLKAEHGTGRNMAPFVEMEWGQDAYRLMQDIKRIFDPLTLLNPGVILNPDPKAHLKDLKPLPAAHELVDKCIECGFCEPICPSKHITLTPRQRITSWREIQRLKGKPEHKAELAKLLKAYGYQGDGTCATDGLCGTRCPVGIDTGKMTKALRAESATIRQKKAADWIGEHFAGVARTVSGVLQVVDAVHAVAGTRFMDVSSETLHRVTGKRVPRWNAQMPKGLGRIRREKVSEGNPLKVVYFPSCIARNMGPARDEKIRPLPETTVSVLRKAGYEVIFPENMGALCCGQAFESKGFVAQADVKSAQLEEALLAASQNGALPVLCDTSPCLKRMQEVLDPRLKIYDPSVFVLEFLQDRLTFTKKNKRVALHVTCTSRKLGLDGKLLELAKKCATHVVVPEDIFCCGFAGDKGFSVPELNASALKTLAEKVQDCSEGYSTSRTCEIGLALHGGIPYRSILYLVDECTG
jgi:D-lactate dehydrogenase